MATDAEINYDDIPELTGEQLKGGVRGKYYKRAMARKALVQLDPNVAAAFPTEAAVNAALRVLIEVARQQVPDSKPLPVVPAGRLFELGKRRINFG